MDELKKMVERKAEAEIKEALAPKKVKPESAPARWARLVGVAKDALQELEEMRSDYGDKFDNMNEGLQASAYGQKCQAMQDLDLQSAIDALDEAESTDLPLGFGRD